LLERFREYIWETSIWNIGRGRWSVLWDLDSEGGRLLGCIPVIKSFVSAKSDIVKSAVPVVNTHHSKRYQGEEVMSKGQNSKKNSKKAAASSPKEKKAAKVLKKAGKVFSLTTPAV